MNIGRPRADDLTETERRVVREIACAIVRVVFGLAALGFALAVLLVGVFVARETYFREEWKLSIVFLWILIAIICFGMSLTSFRAASRRVRKVVRNALAWMPQGDPTAVARLTESRREIVAAFEIERRRIERDLHDGTQQFLVAASMDVGEASLLLDEAVTDGRADLGRMAQVRELLDKAQDDSEAALRALRATVAGIHPKVLSDLGLEAATQSLCATSNLDVSLHVPHALPPIPEGVIAAGYFLVSEGLTNAAKYAPHARVSVLLTADDDLHLTITDEGPGGAVVRPDGGLAGMRERLAAFGGTLSLSSPPGGPTVVSGRVPLLLRSGEFGVSPLVDNGNRSEHSPPVDLRALGSWPRLVGSGGSTECASEGASSPRDWKDL